MNAQRGILVLVVTMIAGCSGLGLEQKRTPEVTLIGVRAPLISSEKLLEAVYFTHLDDKELQGPFDQYPVSLDIAAGVHQVAVVCEWRASTSAPPLAKLVRRFKENFQAGRTYRFTSAYTDDGTCRTSMEIVTQSPTPAPPPISDGN